MAQKNKNIGVGRRVRRRAAPQDNGTIIKAVGAKKWLVKFVSGEEEVKTSAQLVNLARATAAISRVASVASTAKKRLGSRRRGPSTPQSDKSASSIGSFDSSYSSEPEFSPNGSLLQTPSNDTIDQQTSLVLDEVTQNLDLGNRYNPNQQEGYEPEDDPDIDVGEEDEMIHEDVDVDGDDEGEDNMFEHIMDIEDPDERRRAGRQAKFDQMKEGLIANKETYIKTVKPSTAIEVGAPVVTKKKYNGQPKEGVVLRKVFFI